MSVTQRKPAVNAVTNDTIEYVLRHIVHCPNVFAAARTFLDVAHFGKAGESVYRTIWDEICNYHTENDCLPGFSALSERVLSRLGTLQTPGLAGHQDAERSNADDMLRYMYRNEAEHDGVVDEINEADAMAALRRLLIDRVVVSKLLCAGAHNAQALLVEQQRAIAAIDELCSGCSTTKPEWQLRTLDEFHEEATTETDDWLVEDVLVADAGIIGGYSKTMKTSISIDLAVSLGCGPGVKFLGKYTVVKRCRVGFYSDESSKRDIDNMIDRALASKHRKRSDCLLFATRYTPKFTDDALVDCLCREVQRNKLDIVFIDPLNHAIGEAAKDLSNTPMTSQLLAKINNMLRKHNCIMIVNDHANKPAARKHSLSLEDMSYGGAAAWTRQWLLVSRTRPYEEDGEHQLNIRYGGSAGHSGRCDVHISEGVKTKCGPPRHWTVTFGEEDVVPVARLAAKVEEAKQVLKETDMTEGGLRKKLKVGAETAKDVISELKKTGNLKSVGKRCNGDIWHMDEFDA